MHLCETAFIHASTLAYMNEKYMDRITAGSPALVICMPITAKVKTILARDAVHPLKCD